MIFAPKRASRLKVVDISPERHAWRQNCPTEAHETRSKKSYKLNIKIGRYKLPKDFFSSKPDSKNRQVVHRRNNTDREPFNTLSQNQTPKFNQSKVKVSLFQSTRILNENGSKTFPPDQNPYKVELLSDFRPFRQASTHMRVIRQSSSKKPLDDCCRMISLNSHREKSEILYTSDWQRPRVLPSLNLNETLGRTIKRMT